MNLENIIVQKFGQKKQDKFIKNDASALMRMLEIKLVLVQFQNKNSAKDLK